MTPYFDVTQFTDRTYLSYIGSGMWDVTKPYGYYVGSDKSDNLIKVAESYKTDLASIPWFAQWLISVNGDHVPAAVLHDYLYTICRILEYCNYRISTNDYVKFSADGPKIYLIDQKILTRKECDQIFLEAMTVLDRSERFEIPLWERRLMYRCVRLGGHWDMREEKVFKRVFQYDIECLKLSTTHS